MEFRNTYTIEDCYCSAETENAILVESEDFEGWIPQSQIDDRSEVWKKGDKGALRISEWIATQKGIL